MPKLRCPRCNVSKLADEARLDRPVFCSSCGGCVWMPTGLPMTARDASVVPSPAAYRTAPPQLPPAVVVQDYEPPVVQRKPRAEPQGIVPQVSPMRPKVYDFGEPAKGASATSWAMLVMGAVFCACAVTGLVVLLIHGPPGGRAKPGQVPQRGAR